MYEPGEIVALYADIFPAGIDPIPPGVPTTSAVTLRVLLSRDYLTVGWQSGAGRSAEIQRVDIQMTPEQMAAATYRGGMVGDYNVYPVGGCKCRAPAMSGWNPFPGIILDVQARAEQARAASKTNGTYGLIPGRYSRAQ